IARCRVPRQGCGVFRRIRRRRRVLRDLRLPDHGPSRGRDRAYRIGIPRRVFCTPYSAPHSSGGARIARDPAGIRDRSSTARGRARGRGGTVGGRLCQQRALLAARVRLFLERHGIECRRAYVVALSGGTVLLDLAAHPAERRSAWPAILPETSWMDPGGPRRSVVRRGFVLYDRESRAGVLQHAVACLGVRERRTGVDD